MQAKNGLIRTHTFGFDGEAERSARKEQLMSRIADEYLTMPDEETRTHQVRQAYAELAETNAELYEQIPVRIEFVDGDPYDSYADMIESVDRTGVLRIFSGGTHPEFMSRRQNLEGRAVHDWHGHIRMGVDFSLEGEWAKWRGMSGHYSDRTARLLFTEVIGQQCAAHVVGGFDSPDFEQRGIIAPDQWIEAAERYMRMYSPHY